MDTVLKADTIIKEARCESLANLQEWTADLQSHVQVNSMAIAAVECN